MKLSIITPFYKTLELTKKLAKSLEPQLNNEVEWIIVDDGCNERELDNLKARVIHLSNNSGNASTPRNLGLFYAKGEYIAFIDSDDDVMPNYVEKILEKIKIGFDICFISWKSDSDIEIIIDDEPPEWNNSVWNRVYRRNFIGNIRFNPKINYGEDKDFNNKLPKGKTISIKEIIYIYTSKRKDGLTVRYSENKIKYRKK